MLVAAVVGVCAMVLGVALMRWGAYALSKNALAGWDCRLLLGAALVALGLAIEIGDALVWGVSRSLDISLE